MLATRQERILNPLVNRKW